MTLKQKNIVALFLRKFNFLPLLIIAFFFFTVIWWRWANQPVCTPKVSKNECSEIYFEIKKGETLSEISRNLWRKKLIKSQLAFKILVLKNKIYGKIQAGEFYLSNSLTPFEIAKKLTLGTTDRKITILEGWRAEEIGENLIKQGINIDLEEWIKEIKGKELEGYLFPDTYMIPKNASLKKIIEILTRNFEKKFNKDLEKTALTKGIDKHSVVILASLVEREVKHPQDRQVVAGILLKRLEKGWKLQVDSTVQYAKANTICQIGKECDWWPSKLTREDLNLNSPYNTYVYKGLPPGPICNPGLSAIESIIYHKESPFWFYISDSRGNIHYAATAEEHEENIKKYLTKNLFLTQ